MNLVAAAVLLQTSDPVTKDLLYFFIFCGIVALTSLVISVLLQGK